MATLYTNKGLEVEVDEADFKQFSVHSLYAKGGGYIGFWYRKTDNFLHKAIYKEIDPLYIGQVDHKDRNKLNCTRSNLRPATHSQNACNGPTRVDNASGYPGIFWFKRTRKWQVYINIDGERIHLGYYSSLEEAIRIRTEAAIRYHGQFAKELNNGK